MLLALRQRRTPERSARLGPTAASVSSAAAVAPRVQRWPVSSAVPTVVVSPQSSLFRSGAGRIAGQTHDQNATENKQAEGIPVISRWLANAVTRQVTPLVSRWGVTSPSPGTTRSNGLLGLRVRIGSTGEVLRKELPSNANEPATLGSLRPVGIDPAESIGSAVVSPQLRPAGLASSETLGVSVIVQLLTPAAIASSEAIGAHRVSPQLRATGLASSEVIGAATTSPQLRAFGLASSESIGTTTLSDTFSASGIASAEAFGTSVLRSTLPATGIASSEAVGVHTLLSRLQASGLATGEALGVAVVSPSILASAIASAEVIGAAIVEVTSTGPAPVGIASLEQFGSALVFNVPNDILTTTLVKAIMKQIDDQDMDPRLPWEIATPFDVKRRR